MLICFLVGIVTKFSSFNNKIPILKDHTHCEIWKLLVRLRGILVIVHTLIPSPWQCFTTSRTSGQQGSLIPTIMRRVKLGLVEISESFIISSPLRTSTRLTSIYVKARHYKLSKAIPSISHINRLLPSLAMGVLMTSFDFVQDIIVFEFLEHIFYLIWCSFDIEQCKFFDLDFDLYKRKAHLIRKCCTWVDAHLTECILCIYHYWIGLKRLLSYLIPTLIMPWLGGMKSSLYSKKTWSNDTFKSIRKYGGSKILCLKAMFEGQPPWEKLITSLGKKASYMERCVVSRCT